MITCRPIQEADLPGVVNLLVEGFGNKSPDVWLNALQSMARHPSPPQYPRYGYLLASDDTIVGVNLLIFTQINDHVRCNVAAWYVVPAFRVYASSLAARVLKHKNVTYLNVTPAAWTVPTIKALGYSAYSSGRYFALAALAAPFWGTTVAPFNYAAPPPDMPPWEADLMRYHAEIGCLSLVSRSGSEAQPFVVVTMPPGLRIDAIRRRLAYVIYSRGTDAFSRHAGALGRYLVLRGFVGIVIDSEAPLKTIPGIFKSGPSLFYQGPHRPTAGDLAYTEVAMFKF